MQPFIIACVAAAIIIPGFLWFIKRAQGERSFALWFTPVMAFIIISFMSLFAGFTLYSVSEIPPPGPQPEGGCGIVSKLWIEQAGGGGSLLVRNPISTNRYANVRFDDGNEKTISLDADTYGSLSQGDHVSVSWEKEEIANIYRSGEIWTYSVSHDCPANPKP
ncbi:MAG: hypothetical protein ABF537_07940 [Acetobacter sp.]|uniref:hypothetical protein n=1 Tax=Acetobacter sp. TaxID=440 RepID=UPI0039E82069